MGIYYKNRVTVYFCAQWGPWRRRLASLLIKVNAEQVNCHIMSTTTANHIVTVKTKMLRNALSDGQNKNVAKRLSVTLPEAVPTGLGKNGESPLALQRRPSQVSAPHPETKSYATAHNTTSLATLNCRGRMHAPYIGSHSLSRTFLIITDESGTLHRRPLLGRSRQNVKSPEAARQFRNVPNCAVTEITQLPNDAILTTYTATEYASTNTSNSTGDARHHS